MTETCAALRELLSPFADGELAPAEADRVRTHLLSCDSCRETIAAYATVDAAVEAVGSERSEGDWERLAERIDTAIVRQPLPNAGPLALARARKRRWRERLGPRGLSLALGSAGTLLAAVLVILFRPLSEDLVPVDTVPPIGRTSGEPRPKPADAPAAATPERGVLPAPPPPAAEPTPSRERLRAVGYVGGLAEGHANLRLTDADLLRSVEATEALLAETPDGERRVEILSSLVTLWAELVTLDAERHCAAAAAAANEWNRLGLHHPGSAETDAVRRIREACPE